LGGAIILIGVATALPVKPDIQSVLTQTSQVEGELLKQWNQFVATQGKPQKVHQTYVNLHRDETQNKRKIQQVNQTHQDNLSPDLTAGFFRDETIPMYRRHLINVDQLIAQGEAHPSLNYLSTYLKSKLDTANHLVLILPQKDNNKIREAYQKLNQAYTSLSRDTAKQAYIQMAQLLSEEILPKWQTKITDVRAISQQLKTSQTLKRLITYMEYRQVAWELYYKGAAQQDSKLMDRAFSAWKKAEDAIQEMKK
jgi:hypothetical protein